MSIPVLPFFFLQITPRKIAIKINTNDQEIISHIENHYILDKVSISGLSLGADLDTTVYRVTTQNNVYFLKLRKTFSEASIKVPQYLSERGIGGIVSPIKTRDGRLWSKYESCIAVLYPYVDGKNAVESKISPAQWGKIGAIIQQMHTLPISSDIKNGVPKETFTQQFRREVTKYLKSIEHKAFNNGIEKEMGHLLSAQQHEITNMINKAENLASQLKKEPIELVLCHADLHGWNILVEKRKNLYVIDWDTVQLAPKEKDLMFIGAGIWNSGDTCDEEEALFYKGYGPTVINNRALAYYRYERIIQDIAEYCHHIFSSDDTQEHKKQSLLYVKANFRPNGTVKRAHQAYKKIVF